MRGAIFLLFLVIGGPFIAWSGYSHRQLRSRLATEGTTVDATVVSGEERSGRRGSRSYEITVTYQAGSRSLQKEMSVNGTFFQSISSGDSMTVDTVKLTYLNSDPDQAIIVGGTNDTSVNLWIGGVMTVIGLVGGAFWAKSLASSGPGDD